MTTPQNTAVEEAIKEITNLFFFAGANIKPSHDVFLRSVLEELVRVGREERVDDLMGLVIKNSKGYEANYKLLMVDADALKEDLSALTQK